MPRTRRPLVERFMEKVSLNLDSMHDGTPCWDWTGSTTSHGYGEIFISHVPLTSLVVKDRCHRVAWEMLHGPIPDGLWALHLCNRRVCVNPGHLYLGTVKDNARDALRAGVFADRKGVKAGRAILTEGQVRIIRSAPRRLGVVQELAALYGVSRGCIAGVRSGANWSHLEGST